LHAAVRYVERNPVRAGLVKRAWEWPWSSAAGHLSGRGDTLVRPGEPLAAEVSQWRRFLSAEEDEETLTILRRHGRTGRPWADQGKGHEKISIVSPDFPWTS
jgi:putative transposase